MDKCPFCHRPADSVGAINHDGGCVGLKPADMNRLQQHIMETTLKRVQTALGQTSPVLWKSLKAEVDRVLDRDDEKLEHLATLELATNQRDRIAQLEGALREAKSWMFEYGIGNDQVKSRMDTALGSQADGEVK